MVWFLVRDGVGGRWLVSGRAAGRGRDREIERRAALRASSRRSGCGHACEVAFVAARVVGKLFGCSELLDAQLFWLLLGIGDAATRRRGQAVARRGGARLFGGFDWARSGSRRWAHTIVERQDHCWKCKVAGNARLQPSSRDLGRARAEAWGDGRRGALSPGCIDAHQRTTRRARHPSHALRRTFTGRVRGERARLAISSGAAALAHGGRGWTLRCRSACRACPGIFSSWRCALRGRRPATRGRHSRVVAHGGLFCPGQAGLELSRCSKARDARSGEGWGYMQIDMRPSLPHPPTRRAYPASFRCRPFVEDMTEVVILGAAWLYADVELGGSGSAVWWRRGLKASRASRRRRHGRTRLVGWSTARAIGGSGPSRR